MYILTKNRNKIKIFRHIAIYISAQKRLYFTGHPKTQVDYRQRTDTVVKTCNIVQNLLVKPLIIAIFFGYTEKYSQKRKGRIIDIIVNSPFDLNELKISLLPLPGFGLAF